VIESIRHRALRAYWTRGRAGGLNADWLNRLTLILARLDAAIRPEDMNEPGLRFHALGGDMKGRYSVRVTGNWRVTFAWDGENAVDVDLEDYH